MTGGPARGLPPRIYVPIVLVVAFAFLAVIGYLLRIGLGTTGAALGPQQAIAPQKGGANGVGGGTPAGTLEEAPPAPIARLLGELRGRVQRDPRDAAALTGLAQLYSAAGKYAQALPYYQRALALEPTNPDVRTDYATALHGNHDDRSALAQLVLVLGRRPAFAPALFNAGVVASALGERARAVAAFQKFLIVAPGDPRASDARAALKNLGA